MCGMVAESRGGWGFHRAQAPQCIWRHQRTTCRSQFFHSIWWVLGIKTEAVRLDCTCLSLMSHFTSPRLLSLKNVKNISTHSTHLCSVAKVGERGADDEDLSMNCELLTLETKDTPCLGCVSEILHSKSGHMLNFVPNKEHHGVINSIDLNVQSKHRAVRSLWCLLAWQQ